MRSRLVVYWLILWAMLACVDPENVVIQGTNDILVIDGTITNVAEPQLLTLYRAQADRLTGRAEQLPVTQARVEVVVDSTLVVAAHETTDGHYQLPADFKGQIGHAYQLRFALSDGTHYVSTQQVMPAVPPITKVRAEFNPKSLSTPLGGFYTAGHDLFIESQDPAEQHNYYRWSWILYERQYWCRTCVKGVYALHKVLAGVYKDQYYFVAGNEPTEDCFTPPPGYAAYDAPYVPDGHWYYDYACRTNCWEILYGYDITVFDDVYTNGNLITKQRIAQVPFYDYQPGLVDIRQFGLTADAYRYYKLFQDQTQNTGNLVDTPPTALGGNVHEETNPKLHALVTSRLPPFLWCIIG